MSSIDRAARHLQRIETRSERREARVESESAQPLVSSTPSNVFTGAGTRALQDLGAPAERGTSLAVWDARMGQPVLVPGGDGHPEAALVQSCRNGANGIEVQVQGPTGEIRWVPEAEVKYSAPASLPPPVFDQTAKPLARAQYADEIAATPGSFPHLGEDYEAVSLSTAQFNCIAATVGEFTKDEWPGPKISDFDRFYAEHGFVELASEPLTDADFEPIEGMEKVVLYAYPTDSNLWGRTYFDMLRLSARAGQPLDPNEFPADPELAKSVVGPIATHAAIQQEDGSWLTKNGDLGMIEVRDPHQVADGQYGGAVKVYVRPKTERPPFDPNLVKEWTVHDSMQENPPSIMSGDHPIEIGEQGQNVTALQRALVRVGLLSQEAFDAGAGTFGPKTEAAVKAIQASASVPQTGVYDSAAFWALEDLLAAQYQVELRAQA
jgi:hypothetical protein